MYIYIYMCVFFFFSFFLRLSFSPCPKNLFGAPSFFVFFSFSGCDLGALFERVRVDDMLSEHVGTGKMIFPPFAPERVEELGEFVPTDFDIMGAGWREVGGSRDMRYFSPF